MANADQLAILRRGVGTWNKWREENSEVLIDLIGADLRKAELKEVDLHSADLSEARISGANLSGANLFKANLRNVRLKGMFPGEENAEIEFDSVKLCKAYLREAVLFGANLNGADLRAADLSGVILNAAHLRGADLRGAKCLDTNFALAVLSGADLRKAKLYGTIFGGAILDRVNLSGAILPETNLIGSILREANLSKAYLRDAKFNQADLQGANLVGADLNGADLSLAVLSGADFRGANLSRTNLCQANLERTDMRNADLFMSLLIETNLDRANISGCTVYGVSTWGLKLNGTEQRDLVITPPGESVITIDNLEVAQFIYLLLHNEKIRDVIDTVANKAVLILGRFTPERRVVLDALRTELRQRGYLPILFYFEKPSTRDFTETIKILAGMSLFVIADISNPKSSPLELQATIPDYMVPFVPIIQEGEEPFSMFRDLHIKYKKWVLAPLIYDSLDNLIRVLDEAIINLALEVRNELLAEKAAELPQRHVRDYK
jgi:uncharacterized protein YjbI with pentapeptide repeats